MKESLLYKKLNKKYVQCNTCCHACVIAPEKKGICGVRENIHGNLYVLNYGKIITAQIDPIEKKPIYGFLPRTNTYSIATSGCNFKCLHCQNAIISQNIDLDTPDIPPKEVVKNAIESNCPSISYTYTEPTIFLEYALETMRLAHVEKLKNIWVSNGYFSDQTFKLILPYLDAINIDLKSFSDNFYRKICGAKLQPVLDNLIKIYQSKIYLEITTLIIPGKNNDLKNLKQIAEFIKNKLGPEVHWHVTKFYPTYKMLNVSPALESDIDQAVKIGRQIGLKNIF
ncbi:MAG: AmmeMemoRadiSam system radical SAM enzyme [Patescibacteria group bacterium]